MLPVSLDCPFLLPLRYSLTFICPVPCVPYVVSFKDNPEKLATLGTQDTGQKHVREYPWGNKKKTIQRNWQHKVHSTLCCQFLWIVLFLLPLRYSLTCICPVSCVLYVASFSGLSFFITPSVFSNMYLQDTGQIHVREYRRGNNKGQSRETGNIGYTRHRTNKC
jgi:hypothetical protein